MMEFDEAMESEMSPLEYVIQLGAQGSHVLFEVDRIREAFGRAENAPRLAAEDMARVKEAIGEVLSIPDFEGKKEFISALPQNIQDVLIHLYFQMVEKTLLVNQPRYH